MSSLKQENCPNCCNSFTQHNPPRRLINCYHYMCQRCLISQKNCKKCGQDIGLNDHFLKDYVIVSLADIQNQVRSTPKKQIKIVDQVDEHELLQQFQDHEEMEYFEKDEFFVEQCLLHSKPADLICLTDKAIICSSCALFGKHKGHQVSNREGVLTKFTVFVEDCLKIYDQIKEQSRKFSSETFRNEYGRLLLQKKETDQKKISDKFQALISMIRIIQKRQQLKVNEFYKQKQKIFEAKEPKIQKLQSQIKKWMVQIQNIGSLMSDTSTLQKIAGCLPYIDDKTSTGSEILQKGGKLMQKFFQTKTQITTELKKQKETDFIKFDEEKIKQVSQYVTIKGQIVVSKRAQSVPKAPEVLTKSPICLKQSTMKFKSSSKKEHLRTQTDAFTENLTSLNSKLKPDVKVNGFLDDNLLLSVDHSTVPMEKIKDNVNLHLERVQVAEELDVQNIPHLSISDIRPVTNMSSGQSSDQSRFLMKDRELKQFVNEGFTGLTVQINKQDPRKKKKVDFPEKYKGIVDDLKNDRAETIDLTGAEVGDGTILSLCPFIKKSKKLKTLKLIKNKLTDDCLMELFQALAQSRACSLNLSQNLLTDKSCLIISSGPISPYLKTITLTLNKVNRRNVKVKIDEIAKKNVAVLL